MLLRRRFAAAAQWPAFASKALKAFSADATASTFPHITPTNESLSLPQVIPTKKSPVYLYAEGDVDPNAVDQLVRLAESEITVGHVAGMPDVHLGLGVAIGGVFASDKYVCPNAVGVDIGCGMCAVPFQGLYKDDLGPEALKKIHQLLRERIPTAFDSHASQLSGTSVVLDEIAQEFPPAGFVKEKAFVEGKLRARTLKQLGTLGGGNHFIEISYDETRQIWAMLHSGSRHIGNATAARYDAIAKEIMHKKGLHASPGLHYLEIESDEGQSYLCDMLFCQRYAWQNRKHMRDIMINVVNEVTTSSPDESRSVNVHHNFCACERCSFVDPETGERVEKDLWVTRKGATPARAGELGAIPGSMATGSYITRGKGNPDAWSSSSHGAGRRMSRTKALKAINQRDFEHAMEDVVWDAHPSLRDEAPQAYKDLKTVMANQESMVEIVHHLTPIVNVKGLSGKDAYRKNQRQRQPRRRQQRWS